MQRIGILVLVGLTAGGVQRAGADPIAAVFRIDNLRRCIFGACEPLDTTFLLTVSFDTRVTLRAGDPASQIFEEYGPPSFSTIPLDRPPVSATAILDENRSIQTAKYDIDVFHFGLFNENFVRPTSSGGEFWRTGLGNLQDTSPPRTLNAETLIAFVGRGDENSFSYEFNAFDSNGNFTTDLTYLGRAVLSDQAPIPEPGSMVLLGIGCASLRFARRRWTARSPEIDWPPRLTAPAGLSGASATGECHR
jgi:hypothetical protein